MRVPLVSAIAAVVDIVADELVVDADPRVALEASPAATLLGILGEIQVTSENFCFLSFWFNLQSKSKSTFWQGQQASSLTVTVTTHLEGCDDQLEAMRISAPRVSPVLEGDKVGSREEDSVCPEGVYRLLA